MLSLTFLIPIFSNNNVYAAENERQNVAANVCGEVNIRNSLVLSVVTMCLGGVLEKVQEWRQIQCQAVVCNYEAIKFGLDPSFCQKQQEYLTCAYIVGEMFALPPLSVLEYWRDMVAQVVANPIGVVYGAVVKASRLAIIADCSIPPPGTTGFLCNVGANIPLSIPLTIVITADALYVVQTIKELFENGFGGLFADGPQDYCKEVEDIKSEMEEILGIPSSSESEGGFLGIF